MNVEQIKVRLTGGHYQPEGCDTAVVPGIFWDGENRRPCITLLYSNGKTDFIPLSELGSSHVLGDVIILNET
jgi:hypothetical protein